MLTTSIGLKQPCGFFSERPTGPPFSFWTAISATVLLISKIRRSGSGNLFGTTDSGGAYGAGTVFEIGAGSGKVTTLAAFNSSSPLYASGLVEDTSGNLFGTTYQGGDSGDGTVFEVVKGSGTVTTIASFNGPNGSLPLGSLIMDSAGDLFGTTSGGGDTGNGTVFVVIRGSNTITTLASFDGSEGSSPQGRLPWTAAAIFMAPRILAATRMPARSLSCLHRRS